MNKPQVVAQEFPLDPLPASHPTPLDAEPSAPSPAAPTIPEYLSRVYTWAYLTPAYSRYLDTSLVVSSILWGNANRLMRAGFSEFQPGQTVLQPACVYGCFSRRLAEVLGPEGALHVTDVAPNQIEACRGKLADFPTARLELADAAEPRARDYDGVCCFFLLHEVPEDYKHRIVKNLLDATRPGGKTVFVDYHGPHWAHPLRPIMLLVWRLLEPFALSLRENEIASYAPKTLADQFTWSKQTFFGGLYQKVVARRKLAPADRG